MAKAAESGTSRTGRPWKASARPPGVKIDWENAGKYFAARNSSDWMTLFKADPDVMEKIFRDIAHKAHWERQRADGNVRIGRRPGTIGGKREDLYRIIAPELSMEDFPEAFRLLGLGSLRKVEAGTQGLSRSQLFRMTSGSMPPTMEVLEAVASYAGISPAYFKEWRQGFILTAVNELLESNPGLSVSLAKAMGSLQGALSTSG